MYLSFRSIILEHTVQFYHHFTDEIKNQVLNPVSGFADGVGQYAGQPDQLQQQPGQPKHLILR